jgi:hypothetical protein
MVFALCVHQLYVQGFTHSIPELSRRHHLHPFQTKLRFGMENIWRAFVNVNDLNNVSSNFVVKMTLGENDLIHSNPDLSGRHHLPTLSQKLSCGWETIWRKFVGVDYLNNVSSKFVQGVLSNSINDDGIFSFNSDLSRRYHLPTFYQKLKAQTEKYLKKSCSC